MKIGIFYNQTHVTEETALSLARYVEQQGHESTLFSSAAEIDGVDRLTVLGGDGTVLRAARRAAELKIPLVGVNFGTRGFLTEFERDGAREAIGLVLDQNAAVIHRSMLEIKWNGASVHCLNELSMSRLSEQDDNSIIKISVTIDGTPAGEFAADGLIVATPTGSTAYSLSAGGSIMTPDCETFLLTPICAFSMRSRPIVFSDKSVLSFSFPTNRAVGLYGDGMFLGKAGMSDRLTVKKSTRFASFLTKGKGDFFHRLTEKIN